MLNDIDDLMEKVIDKNKNKDREELERAEEERWIRFVYESVKLEGNSLSYEEVREILRSIKNNQEEV